MFIYLISVFWGYITYVRIHTQIYVGLIENHCLFIYLAEEWKYYQKHNSIEKPGKIMKTIWAMPVIINFLLRV